MIRKIKRLKKQIGYKGMMCTLKAKMQQKTPLFKITPKNHQHPLWLRINTSDVLTYQQVFVDDEYLFKANQQPNIIVDAGANIGLASIYFANKFPNARIIAIEPEQSNYELLKKNTEAYSNIEAVHAALWNKNEQINLIDPGFGNWGFMTDDSDDASRMRNTVKAVTVNELMSSNNIDTIDILKIDIEGAEKEVFEDTSRWLDKIDTIIVELHEHMKPGCNRNFYLGSIGFDNEWMRGENVYLSRNNAISKL